MERIYNKLVRDRIPQIIEETGETPVTKILSETEFKAALEQKCYEEYQEMLHASGRDRLFELADMLEIIKQLAQLENTTLEELCILAEQKNAERGSFDQKIFLEKVLEIQSK